MDQQELLAMQIARVRAGSRSWRSRMLLFSRQQRQMATAIVISGETINENILPNTSAATDKEGQVSET